MDGTKEIVNEMIYFGLFDLDESVYFKGDLIDLQEAKIMQSTGLTDKNGKKIYEGDILQNTWKNFGLEEDNTDVLYEVVFEKGGFQVKGHRAIEGETRRITEINLYDTFEIIGDIYSNPGLITNP